MGYTTTDEIPSLDIFGFGKGAIGTGRVVGAVIGGVGQGCL
jgi:hypothetical protein